MAVDEPYRGFEQGPIRPPSERDSLLVRVTRNCPWNRCTFCSLYKGERFSRRPVAHVLRDIDAVRRAVDRLSGASLPSASPMVDEGEWLAEHAARTWLQAGCRSVFLQDSTTLSIPPGDLETILLHLRASFPSVERVTSYARSQTVARISDEDLARLHAAGLNRIHIGLESGCDVVLERVRKGADQATHIRAGQKVKRAGIELSEYYMPGLGGRELSRQHALDSAKALSCIDPDFIRLRTLALPDGLDLADEAARGRFTPMNDREVAEELLLFLEALTGITSRVVSDHILNLFEEIEGRLPEDHGRMTAVIHRFLALDPAEQLLYRVGRRTGVFQRLDDLQDPVRRGHARHRVERFAVTPENVDRVCAALMQRFI